MAIQLSNADTKKVINAIAEVETETSAEVFAVLAERSDDYRFVGYSYFALWIFILSAILAFWFKWRGMGIFSQDWNDTGLGIAVLMLSQLAAFLTGMVLLRVFPNFASLLVPRKIAHERAHNNAVKQFLAHGIHNTTGRTGVLVFVSLQERYAEIIVDAGIEKEIGRAFFLDQVGELIEDCKQGNIAGGYEKAIRAIGKMLAEKFPPSPGNANEIADKLIVL